MPTADRNEPERVGAGNARRWPMLGSVAGAVIGAGLAFAMTSNAADWPMFDRFCAVAGGLLIMQLTGATLGAWAGRPRA